MDKNLIPIASIYIPPDKDARIREPENLAKAVKEKTRSILRFGQMQPILVSKLERDVGDEDKEWELVDGQVRLVSLLALSARHMMDEEEVKEAFEKWDLKPFHIEVTTRDTLDPITAFMMEFHANEDRDNFTWDEKASYIRRIHDMLVAKAKGKKEKWTAKQTAEAISQSEATVSQYLKLTDAQDPATQSERVKKATTKGAALKKLQIEQEVQKRKARVEKAAASPEKAGVKDAAEAAKLAIYHGDCREWITKIPDNSLAWFHWDPPYGGAEGDGGAFAAHSGIDTDHEYALKLMLEMLGEIHRVLFDGAWLAIWYTPVHYHWLRLALQGHRFDPETSKCLFCSKHIIRDAVWLADNYSCVKAPHRFWVNPYPNLWRKPDRAADGHEITRFFIKETEPFLLAGKQGQKTPILLRTDRSNVFNFNSVPREARRHVNHKPWALLAEILSCISVPGALGGDAGVGSGSIIEAAFNTKRLVIGADIREENVINSREVALKIFEQKKVSASSIASWFPLKFTE